MYLCVNMCEGSVIVNNSQLFRREGKEKRNIPDQTDVGSMQIKIRERQWLLIANSSPHTDHDYTSTPHSLIFHNTKLNTSNLFYSEYFFVVLDEVVIYRIKRSCVWIRVIMFGLTISTFVSWIRYESYYFIYKK